MASFDFFENLSPISRYTLMGVIIMHGTALAVWVFWLGNELRQDTIRAREKKRK
jgi:hypothetical protein